MRDFDRGKVSPLNNAAHILMITIMSTTEAGRFLMTGDWLIKACRWTSFFSCIRSCSTCILKRQATGC